MKPERAFVAERPVARHAAQLVRSGPARADLLADLHRMGERLARELPRALHPLLGSRPEAHCDAPAESTFAAVTGSDAPLAMHALLGIGSDTAPLLATIEAQTLLSLVDRAFGGKGNAGGDLLCALPLSADLMAARLETLLCESLAAALGPEGGAVRVLHRDTDLANLAPFAAQEPLATLRTSVREEGRDDWSITLAAPFRTLADLFASGARKHVSRGPATPADAPFRDVPLPLRAVLVDMALPLSALSALEPGQIIPVPVARQVPLRIGTATVAHGAVGSEDDRIAVRIARIS
ncbi:FliM/FliN family flagellar motor switch protein [Novosphingobium sp. ZN18A2]|uniref:flagellar motor switch protein FliM n=1 Tax=Novosphingobium sp. ZN18A2 TaxID=3079861 RepID=UPI0030CAD1BB